jgi:hypothetical protein
MSDGIPCCGKAYTNNIVSIQIEPKNYLGKQKYEKAMVAQPLFLLLHSN